MGACNIKPIPMGGIHVVEHRLLQLNQHVSPDPALEQIMAMPRE